MNFKTTILLLVILLGIGGYVLFTRHADQSADQIVQPTPGQGKKLTDLTADDISKVSIKPANGAEIVLQKAGTDWRLAEPTSAPADPSAVSTLISGLLDLRSTSQLTADQKPAAGLDKPPYAVELADKSGKVTTFAFGAKPAFGDALDVIVNNADKPDVVSASIYSQLEQPASAYRKTSLVSVSPDQIQQINVDQSGGHRFEITRSGADWQLAALSTAAPSHSPAKSSFKADSTAVADMTSALAGLSAKTFVDEQHPLSYFGLTSPSMTVWFSTSAPTTEPAGSQPAGTTILIGRPVDVSKADVYASVNGQIVTLPNVTADTFRKSALDLRDKTVLDIDPATVTSINIVADRTPETKALGPNIAPRWNMTYQRKQESHVAGPPLPTTTTTPTTAPAKPTSHWNAVSGMRVGNADDAKVDALLSIFHPMVVQKYIDSAATTQPASTYDITIKAGPTRTETIKITDRGGDNPLLGSYGNAIFELDRALLPKINGDSTTK